MTDERSFSFELRHVLQFQPNLPNFCILHHDIETPFSSFLILPFEVSHILQFQPNPRKISLNYDLGLLLKNPLRGKYYSSPFYTTPIQEPAASDVACGTYLTPKRDVFGFPETKVYHQGQVELSNPFRNSLLA